MKIYMVKISDSNEEKLDSIWLHIHEEKARKIQSFTDKKNMIRTLVGEILIRTIIIKELRINNKCIIFEKNKYGKPYLKNYPTFNFNISYSGNYVTCAISEWPIGIDIEQIKYINYKKIAQSVFSTNEFEYITNSNVSIQLDRFYEIWTLKESFIKCCGKGLAISLKSFSVLLQKRMYMCVII
ncbi:4'-phosphopantetheinyl transferase superfamily protein [Clostridium sp.]|uniref:4'-phosphopantetheinyl transferase family protein n=1 Tax=Clostridium sp. TaxID=1506 RepID=UPI00260A2F76|nr:4'-phosphopantetheinyl transferase superfamily protein [Clostridium sp.]